MVRTTRVLLASLLSTMATSSSGFAQTKVADLANLSIEELMNIAVTSASRKEERATDVAAAIFVITQEDIRRSGMTTVPDLLRLAPGVDVAQINASKWAVSVRGFNGIRANKLLVLVDGRSVYNRLFSGVLWDGEELMLDDIDRIEVIRGPGAAMWGANAVNGVINIVTKAAADTQGGLTRVEAGRAGTQAAVRFGGTVGTAHYRLFAQWTGRHESLIAPGTGADDASETVTTGVRADWTAQPGTFTMEGAFTAGQAHALWSNLDPRTFGREPISTEHSHVQGGHLLGRWSHTRTGGATLQIQAFIDLAERNEPVGNYGRHTVDLDTQYHASLGAHHDLVAGAGYRFIGESFDGHVGVSLTPAEDNSSLVTAFLQDEIALLGNRLAVTLGSQVQYDADFGAGIQPTARVMWKVRPRQRLWAAASRALRTPSLQDRGMHVDFPPRPGPGGLPLFVTIQGNPAAETEKFIDAEAGYRIEIGTTVSVDVTGFIGRYDDLRTNEQTAPIVRFVPSPRILVATQFGNSLRATTRGLEISARWMPVSAWRLDGSYTAFHLSPHPAAGSQDPAAATEDGNAPRTQWQVRSAFAPGPRATVDVAIYHVGPLDQFQVEGYTRADVTAEWRFTSRLSVMAIGQNLVDAAHTEFASGNSLLQATQTPRNVSLRLKWMFQ